MKKETQHPYANILRAIADGEEIQWQASSGNWLNKDHGDSLIEIGQMTYVSSRYRVKPKTITINGFDVHEPLRQMPPPDTEVFWPSFGPNASDANTENCGADFYPVTLANLLENCLLHSTQEAASAHALALISLTKNKRK